LRVQICRRADYCPGLTKCFDAFMKPGFTLLFTLTAAALILAGCATTHSWEYRTRTTKERIGTSVLDGYGKSGWELVSFTCLPADRSGTNFEYEYIFKRPGK